MNRADCCCTNVIVVHVYTVYNWCYVEVRYENKDDLWKFVMRVTSTFSA